MATIHNPETAPATYVPRWSAEERARRNQSALDLLASWETEGDEQEQRETLALLREALGPKRVASSRSLLP